MKPRAYWKSSLISLSPWICSLLLLNACGWIFPSKPPSTEIDYRPSIKEAFSARAPKITTLTKSELVRAGYIMIGHLNLGRLTKYCWGSTSNNTYECATEPLSGDPTTVLLEEGGKRGADLLAQLVVNASSEIREKSFVRTKSCITWVPHRHYKGERECINWYEERGQAYYQEIRVQLWRHDPQNTLHDPQRTLLVLFHEVKDGNVEAITNLLKKGVDVNASGVDEFHGKCALEIAAESNRVPILNLLLAHGANPNNPSCRPLRGAAKRGQLDVVTALLSQGAKVNDDGPRSEALLTAVSACHPALTKLLLEAGANPNQPGPDGLENMAQLAKKLMKQSAGRGDEQQKAKCHQVRQILGSAGARF